MLTYEEELSHEQLHTMLEEEFRVGEDNLDAMHYLRDITKRDSLVWSIIQVLLLISLGFLIHALISQTSQFIAPVFEPFVIPVCILMCFLLYNAYLEYRRISTQLHQLIFFIRRLERSLSFAKIALDLYSTPASSKGENQANA